MPSKVPDFIKQMQSEGTTTERRLEKVDNRERVHKESRELASKMPPAPEKQTYVGNLLRQALTGKLNVEVFKEFVKLTNTYKEVNAVESRIKLQIKGGK